MEEQRSSLKRLQQDLRRRERALYKAGGVLNTMMSERKATQRTIEDLQKQVGAPDSPKLFPPGHSAPFSGLYRVFHEQGCDIPRILYIKAGWAFPHCKACREAVLYRFIMAVEGDHTTVHRARLERDITIHQSHEVAKDSWAVIDRTLLELEASKAHIGRMEERNKECRPKSYERGLR